MRGAPLLPVAEDVHWAVDVQLIDIIGFGDDGLDHEHWGVFDALG